jgi:hypothetical protein
MIFQNLLNQIKSEARVRTDDNFDAVIIDLLNEIFQESVSSQRPFELREEVSLTFSVVTGYIDLPDDFFLHHSVDFHDVDTDKIWPLSDQDEAISPAPRGFYGHPKHYEVVGTRILVAPISSLIVGDKLILVYYKKPPTITTETLIDENPIPRLEPYLIRSAIRRIRMLHTDDVQVVQMFQQDMVSAARGYVKDEPQAPPEKYGSR